MSSLKYLSGYAPQIKEQVQAMIEQDKLSSFLLNKYPKAHNISNDKELREYVMGLKTRFLKKSSPLSKIAFDPKIHVINNALGLHSYVTRVQGGKLKSKNEIRVATVFKQAPEEFLKMIVVHELAHLKEKDHNKSFYQLCEHMLPSYHQIEFDMRVYLTHIDLQGDIYS